MIHLSWYNSHFVPSDLGKLAEQWGDVICGTYLIAPMLSTAFEEYNGAIIGIRCLRTCMMCTCTIGKTLDSP